MLVRSLRNHYHDVYRSEGEEFDYQGELYEHIVPVDPKLAEQAEKAGKAPAPDDKPDNKPDNKHDQKKT